MPYKQGMNIFFTLLLTITNVIFTHLSSYTYSLLSPFFVMNQSIDSQKMELELGLKLRKVVDDFNSVDLLIAKDRAGSLFLSQEIDSMYILTAHLKGYRRKNIKIDINEDGSRIAISGEKPVQEMVMVGWRVVKKETEIRGFRKAFKIPNGVILDKIKAKFNEDESILKILMPKLVKVVTGVGIEELKEEEILKGATEPLKVVADEGETSQQENCGENLVEKIQEIDQPVDKLQEATRSKLAEEMQELGPKKEEKVGSNDLDSEKIQEEKFDHFLEKTDEESRELESGKPKKGSEEKYELTRSEPDSVTQQEELREEENDLQAKGSEKEEFSHDAQEKEKPIIDQELEKQSINEDQDNEGEQIGGMENDIQEEEEKGRATQMDKSTRRRTSKICAPIIVGSALLVSLVFAFHLIRSKNQTTKKRN